MTIGLRRTGAYTPSPSPAVTAIRAQAAALIDLIETVPADGETGPEIRRLKDRAQEAAELSAMWAIKAALA